MLSLTASGRCLNADLELTKASPHQGHRRQGQLPRLISQQFRLLAGHPLLVGAWLCLLTEL